VQPRQFCDDRALNDTDLDVVDRLLAVFLPLHDPHEEETHMEFMAAQREVRTRVATAMRPIMPTPCCSAWNKLLAFDLVPTSLKESPLLYSAATWKPTELYC